MERVAGKIFGGDGAIVCKRVVFLYAVGSKGWSGNFDVPSSTSGPLTQPELSIELTDGRRARIVVRSISRDVAHFVGSGPPPGRRR